MAPASIIAPASATIEFAVVGPLPGLSKSFKCRVNTSLTKVFTAHAQSSLIPEARRQDFEYRLFGKRLEATMTCGDAGLAGTGMQMECVYIGTGPMPQLTAPVKVKLSLYFAPGSTTGPAPVLPQVVASGTTRMSEMMTAMAATLAKSFGLAEATAQGYSFYYGQEPLVGHKTVAECGLAEAAKAGVQPVITLKWTGQGPPPALQPESVYTLVQPMHGLALPPMAFLLKSSSNFQTLFNYWYVRSAVHPEWQGVYRFEHEGTVLTGSTHIVQLGDKTSNTSPDNPLLINVMFCPVGYTGPLGPTLGLPVADKGSSQVVLMDSSQGAAGAASEGAGSTSAAVGGASSSSSSAAGPSGSSPVPGGQDQDGDDDGDGDVIVIDSEGKKGGDKAAIGAGVSTGAQPGKAANESMWARTSTGPDAELVRLASPRTYFASAVLQPCTKEQKQALLGKAYKERRVPWTEAEWLCTRPDKELVDWMSGVLQCKGSHAQAVGKAAVNMARAVLKARQASASSGGGSSGSAVGPLATTDVGPGKSSAARLLAVLPYLPTSSWAQYCAMLEDARQQAASNAAGMEHYLYGVPFSFMAQVGLPALQYLVANPNAAQATAHAMAGPSAAPGLKSQHAVWAGAGGGASAAGASFLPGSSMMLSRRGGGHPMTSSLFMPTATALVDAVQALIKALDGLARPEGIEDVV